MASHHPPPPNPAHADAPSGNNPELPSLPFYVVTKPSQLPVEFLEPSADQKLVIGFDCEGVDLCRHGTLCIMQLAFPDAIYLVDAIESGKELIEACKPALESDHITKVIHDCKRDSEALYFQFGIKLHNVMDTQIAYSLIEEQEGNKRAYDVYISFVSLLADPHYCGMPYPEKEEVRILLRQDPNFWKNRPLSKMMIRAATDDVRFLLNIYEKMMEKLSRVSLWRVAVRSELYCRCFCINDSQYADWPPLPTVPDDIEAEVHVPEVDILSLLDVPLGKMGRVIGRKGSSIMAVKESCNVEIHIGGAKGPPDRLMNMSGPRWKKGKDGGKDFAALAAANPMSRIVAELQSSLKGSKLVATLSSRGVDGILGVSPQQAMLLNRAAFGRAVENAGTEKHWFQLGPEEVFYLCHALKCITVESESKKQMSEGELWDHLSSTAESFAEMYKAYSHLRSKNWVVRSGLQYGADFVAYRHHPALVHSEFAVVVVPEGVDFGTRCGRLKAWSDLLCALRASGSVAKTLLVLTISSSIYELSSPHCLEQLVVHERTITRWIPQQSREERCEPGREEANREARDHKRESAVSNYLGVILGFTILSSLLVYKLKF